MQNSFNTENETRNAARRIGITPQRKAMGNEREILHLWAVRPASRNNAASAFIHENINYFAPESNIRLNGANPFEGMNKSSTRQERNRRIDALLSKWGVAPSNTYRIRDLGEGVSGIVSDVPVDIAQKALIGASYIVFKKPALPSSGSVAIKFQIVRDDVDLRSCILETQIQAILMTGRSSNNIPGSSQYIPKLYGAWYDPNYRLYVSVMQIAQGKPLEDILKRRKLSRAELTEVTKAFVALWRRGVFHSDAHSGNVMIDTTPNGRPKVTIIDFGQSVFLPPELRPTSMLNASNANRQLAIENYVARLKVNQSWFNPNTRTLKILRAWTNNRRNRINVGQSNNQTNNFKYLTNNNSNRNSNRNRNKQKQGRGATTNNNTTNNRPLNVTNVSKLRNSNLNSYSNSYNGTYTTNNSAPPMIVKSNNKLVVVNQPTNKGRANSNNMRRNNMNNRNNNLNGRNSNRNNNRNNRPRNAGPTERKKMIGQVTNTYKNMLNKLVNKSKKVVFIKTA